LSSGARPHGGFGDPRSAFITSLNLPATITNDCDDTQAMSMPTFARQRLCFGSRTMDTVWMIYNWIDDLAGPYGAAIVVSGALIGAIYWVLSASR